MRVGKKRCTVNKILQHNHAHGRGIQVHTHVHVHVHVHLSHVNTCIKCTCTVFELRFLRQITHILFFKTQYQEVTASIIYKLKLSFNL